MIIPGSDMIMTENTQSVRFVKFWQKKYFLDYILEGFKKSDSILAAVEGFKVSFLHFLSKLYSSFNKLKLQSCKFKFARYEQFLFILMISPKL